VVHCRATVLFSWRVQFAETGRKRWPPAPPDETRRPPCADRPGRRRVVCRGVPCGLRSSPRASLTPARLSTVYFRMLFTAAATTPRSATCQRRVNATSPGLGRRAWVNGSRLGSNATSKLSAPRAATYVGNPQTAHLPIPTCGRLPPRGSSLPIRRAFISGSGENRVAVGRDR
jgi:hypothetical protein